MTKDEVPPTFQKVLSSPFWSSLCVAIVYAGVLLVTRSVNLGDTPEYAQTVAAHLRKSPFGSVDTLWEFGHLLWRPIGWVLLTALSPLLSRVTAWTAYMQAAFVLIVISCLCGMVNVVLWYRMLFQFSRSAFASALVALALACAHGVLLYVPSGSSYVPGLTCLTVSVFLIRKDRVALAAFFYALSALLWLPYILAGPGLALLLAAPSDWSVSMSRSLRALRFSPVLRFAAVAAPTVAITYCLAGAAYGVHSAAEAKSWSSDSAHGWSQSATVVRLATGLPRSIYYLGLDGMLFKRYLRHDPYAPVKAIDLARASLWKIGAFYLFLAVLFACLLWRSPSGWPLSILLAAAIPVVFFAVVLFEPSSPPRFLPVFPFGVLALGSALAAPVRHKASTAFFYFFLASVVLSNGYAFSLPVIHRANAAAWSRIAGVRARIVPHSVVVVTTNQDVLEDYLSRSIFGPVNRPEAFQVYDIVEPGTVRTLQWRQEFAAEVLAVWDKGGEVWLTRRVWSARPQPDWNWAERDDPREIWSDLVSFFQPLKTDVDTGGSDGFSRLARSESNLRYLAPIAAEFKPSAPRSNMPTASSRAAPE
jgi:hypothetical protein